MATPEQWEYLSTILYASIENTGAREYIEKRWPGRSKTPWCDVETMTPVLNRLGEAGWELLQMTPVEVHGDGKVSFGISSNAYLCAFKRRRSS